MRASPITCLILAAVTLAACTQGPARPVSVDLSRTLLEVRMSDNSTCRGPAPASGAEAGWSGRLQGCPWSYPYEVEIEPGTNPVRFVLEEVFEAIGLEDAIAPVATVRITDATGRTRSFASPEEIPLNELND